MSGGSFQIADLFEAVAAAIPERTALVSGATRLSFAELDRRADRVAEVLRGFDVGPGRHVGLHLYNGGEYVETMLRSLGFARVWFLTRDEAVRRYYAGRSDGLVAPQRVSIVSATV